MLLRIKAAARLTGLHPHTLRRMFDSGELRGTKVSGQRFFRREDLESLCSGAPKSGDRAVVYARVSTKKQEETGNLTRQTERLESHIRSIGMEHVGTFTDVASGLNENRRGLHRMMRAVADGKATHVFVEYRDRLARFGFPYLEAHLKTLGARVVVLEDTESKSPNEELVNDLVAIVTSFSARIYGARGGAVAKKMREAMDV